VSLATYLVTLDRDRLEALLRRRPNVLVDPAPRTVDELAMRLNGIDSLTRALELPPPDGAKWIDAYRLW
jgi:hypothetical protein